MDITDELYREHYHGALLYVNSLCGNYHLAEDIVSDSFYKAFGSYKGDEDGFKLWLFRVCRNAFIDHIRKNKGSAELTDNLSDKTDVAEAIIEQEKYRSLYRAIELLGDEHREAISLFYFNDMSIAQIARLTKKTEAAVKVTLYRARRKLKEILEVGYGI